MLPGSSFFFGRPSGILGMDMLFLAMSYLGGSLLAAQMLLTRVFTESSKLAPDLAGAAPRPSRSGLTYRTSEMLLDAVMTIARIISHIEQLL